MPERCDRGRVDKRCSTSAKLLARRIVMIAKKIVRLDNLDIVNLGRLQNFAGALCAGDV